MSLDVGIHVPRPSLIRSTAKPFLLSCDEPEGFTERSASAHDFRIAYHPRMRRALGHATALLMAYLAGATTVGLANAGPDGRDRAYRSLATFARVLSYVENNFVREISAEALVHGAVRGMLATLDAHSAFLDPAQYAAMQSEARGEFGGIGVELVKRAGGARIVERYDGSPARKAGLEVGDTIVAVDGEATAMMSLAEIARRIKGATATAVQLEVRGPGAAVRRVRVVRARIQLMSVDARRLTDGLAYLRIRAFGERTGQEVADVLRTLRGGPGLSGLVIDLRDNPGGLLDEAVRVADLWLSTGVIVTTVGRREPADQELAHPKGTEPNYPVVLLVNGGTASAAEIVAGALQDQSRAHVMGTQTFGKGSVQTVIELEDRSALKLTIARYFTPKHRSIEGVGITPDQVVPQLLPDQPSSSAGAVDPQLDAAVDYLRNRVASR